MKVQCLNVINYRNKRNENDNRTSNFNTNANCSHIYYLPMCMRITEFAIAIVFITMIFPLFIFIILSIENASV